MNWYHQSKKTNLFIPSQRHRGQLLNPVRPKQIPSNTSLNYNRFQISTALKRKSGRTLLLMLAQTLQVDQLKVPPALSDQLAMRTVLHDPALVEDVDHVGFLDGR